MKRALQLATVAVLMLLCAAAAEVVDRIIAVVNHEPVLQSEVEDAAAFEALVDGRTPGPLDAATRKAVLDRLIDQRLIEQQLRNGTFPHASDADVTARIAEIRHQHPAGNSDAEWQRTLAAANLTPAGFTEGVRKQLDQIRFVDARLRPAIRLSDREIERYYRDQYLPQLRKAGAGIKPLNEVRPQIEQVLTEQRLNALIGSWIENLRAQASIDIRAPQGGEPNTTRAEGQAHAEGVRR